MSSGKTFQAHVRQQQREAKKAAARVLAYADAHGKVFVPNSRVKPARRTSPLYVVPLALAEARMYAMQEQDQQDNPEFYRKLGVKMS